jgi:Integral membrane protein, interacts with FtsH
MFSSQSYSYPEAKPQTFSSSSEGLRESIRVNFIRKVFSIVSGQLLFTAAFSYLSMNSKAIAHFQATHPGILSLAAIVTLITSLALSFSNTLSRKVPTNYIVLSLFTLAESYTISAITGNIDPSLVYTAFFLTGAAVGVLAIYAMTTKTEITYFGGLIGLIGLGMLGILFLSLFGNFKFIQMLSLVGSSILVGLYFIYDIKAIMGKDHIRVSLDDYIRGAMTLYIDIIQIFIKILQILMSQQEKEEERRKKKK